MHVAPCPQGARGGKGDRPSAFSPVVTQGEFGRADKLSGFRGEGRVGTGAVVRGMADGGGREWFAGGWSRAYDCSVISTTTSGVLGSSCGVFGSSKEGLLLFGSQCSLGFDRRRRWEARLVARGFGSLEGWATTPMDISLLSRTLATFFSPVHFRTFHHHLSSSYHLHLTLCLELHTLPPPPHSVSSP